MRFSALLSCATFAFLAGAASASQVAHWPIEVGASGWVEVELDAEVLARLGPAGGVEVLAPSGAAVPARRLLAAETRRCRAVAVGSVERVGEAYALALNLGPMPGPHAALRFALDERTLAPGCRLEVEEGRVWRELARADLFRLGEGSGLDATWFEYPESRAKRLRLLWPAAAGYPAVRAVEACEPEPQRPVLRLPVDGIDPLATSADLARFRLPTPAVSVPLRALRLETGDSSRPAAYRLSFAEGGRWHPWVEGAWPAGAADLRIALVDAAFPGGAVRLDLFGGSPRPPVATWELAPQSLRFRAETPGRYLLRVPAAASSFESERSGPATLRAALGPLGLERVEAVTAALGAVPEQREQAASYAVLADRVAIGAPVALVLPPEAGGHQEGRARLVFGGRQVPFRTEGFAEPLQIARQDAMAPDPMERGRSRLPLPVPLDGTNSSSYWIELLAARNSGPFERQLHVELTSDAPGRPAARLATTLWRCRPAAAPCALGVDVSLPERRRGDRLFLSFADGDAAPLGPIAVEVGQPGRHALFQWPGPGVELRLAREPLEPARFDLSQLAAALDLAAPALARLGPRTDTEPGWLEGRAKLLLALGVALAAAILLALVARLLPRRPTAAAGPREGDPPGSGPPG